MPKRRREIELKLELTAAQLKRAMTAGASKPYKAERATTQRLTSTYFDTPDLALTRQQIALRLRHDGKSWTQTVKCGSGVPGGVSSPIEDEARVEVDGASPMPSLDAIGDKRLRKAIAAVAAAELLPQVEVEVVRVGRRLTAPDGSVVELALDKGEVKAAGRRVPILEAEIELIKGDPWTLLEYAAHLVPTGALTPAIANKPAKGFTLIAPELATSLVPEKAQRSDIGVDDTCRTALSAMLAAGARHILHNWRVVLEGEDPEGPHQLRVGLRRMRTCLAMMRLVVETERLGQMTTSLRELARVVGELRDLDVLATDIVRPVSEHASEEVSIEGLIAALEAEGREARQRVRDTLSSREGRMLGAAIALLPHAFDKGASREEKAALGQPIVELARRALERRWHKLAALGERIDDLDEERRHEMRKALKGLRYAIELVAPLYREKAVRRYLKHASALQDVLGYLNDVATAETLPRRQHVAAHDDISVACAAGLVIGWHTARAEIAWAEAKAGWAELAAAERFWR